MKLSKLEIIDALSVAMKQAEAFGKFDVANRLHAYRENIHRYMNDKDCIYLSDLIYLVAKETNLIEQLAHTPSSQEQSGHENGKDPRQKNGE